MVNIKALEAAINRVENVRHHEFSFEVDGQTIALRILRPEEEAEVQKYAQVALDAVEPDGPPDQGAYMDLMNRMRQATLGYAIVQLGDLDLRNEEFVETDQVDNNGNPISVPKHEAIRELVKEWGQHMLSEVSQKYGDLVDRAEIHATKVVKYDPVDLDGEIARLENRLKDLRTAKAKRDGPSPAPGGPVPEARQGPAHAVSPTQEGPAGHSSAHQPPQPQASSPQSSPSQSAQGRRSAVPQSAPARERQPQQASPQGSQQPQGPQQPQPGQEPPKEQYVDEQGIMLPDGGDSFFDPSDPAEAMAIESRRQAMLHQQHLARQRAKAQEAQMRRELGIPSPEEHAKQMMENQRQNSRPNAVDLSGPSPGRSVDTLREAANLHNAVRDANTGSVRPGRPNRARPTAAPQGKPAELHGKPVYKMPTQTLDRPENERRHGDPAPGPVQMNPSAGGRNPNFRPKGS